MPEIQVTASDGSSIGISDEFGLGVADALDQEHPDTINFVRSLKAKYVYKHLKLFVESGTGSYEDVVLKNNHFKKISPQARLAFEAELLEKFDALPGNIGALAAQGGQAQLDLGPLVDTVAKALKEVKETKEQKTQQKAGQVIIDDATWKELCSFYPTELSTTKDEDRAIVQLIAAINKIRAKHAPPVTNLEEEILALQKALQDAIQDRFLPGKSKDAALKNCLKRALNVTVPNTKDAFRRPAGGIFHPGFSSNFQGNGFQGDAFQGNNYGFRGGRGAWRGGGQSGRGGGGRGNCFKCGQPGHIAKFCTN